jgi:hypothetical protein
MLAVDIAACLLVKHGFDTENDIEDRAEKHGHNRTVVILFHFSDLAAAFHFDLAHQAVRAVPIIGGEWFPAVDSHAAQGTVATVAKCFVTLGLAEAPCIAPRTLSRCILSRTLATTSALKAFRS